VVQQGLKAAGEEGPILLQVLGLFFEDFSAEFFEPAGTRLLTIDDAIDFVGGIDLVNFKVLDTELFVFSHVQDLNLFQHKPTPCAIAGAI
jgi:hypothetical protein